MTLCTKKVSHSHPHSERQPVFTMVISFLQHCNKFFLPTEIMMNLAMNISMVSLAKMVKLNNAGLQSQIIWSMDENDSK